jgi:hypothetical protein
MWNRACPLCFTKVPRGLILTLGNHLACPSCHAALELSRGSRVAGAFGGLFCGFVVWHAMNVLTGGGWALPIVAAVLAYGIGSAMVLYFLSDLAVEAKSALSDFPQAQK